MTTKNTINETHDVAADDASDALLTKKELAPKLRISRRSVDNWVRNRKIPYYKLGKSIRFRWADVLEKLNAYRVN
jgi:excisionase family DNA binding protein